MSQSKSQHEAYRWWLTASEDLEAAKIPHAAGKSSHACFLALQSAEKDNFFLEQTRKLIEAK